MEPCIQHVHHDYDTHYVSDRQTIVMKCRGREFGAIQRTPSGTWLPRFGQGLASELPPASEPLSPYVDVAMSWIEARHREEQCTRS